MSGDEKCGCAFTKSANDIVEHLRELQFAMPSFQRHAELYPKDEDLQVILQNIFEDYIDFCIIIVKFLRRRKVKTPTKLCPNVDRNDWTR